jgi:hypothetical protein
LQKLLIIEFRQFGVGIVAKKQQKISDLYARSGKAAPFRGEVPTRIPAYVKFGLSRTDSAGARVSFTPGS